MPRPPRRALASQRARAGPAAVEGIGATERLFSAGRAGRWAPLGLGEPLVKALEQRPDVGGDTSAVVPRGAGKPAAGVPRAAAAAGHAAGRAHAAARARAVRRRERFGQIEKRGGGEDRAAARLELREVAGAAVALLLEEHLAPRGLNRHDDPALAEGDLRCPPS